MTRLRHAVFFVAAALLSAPTAQNGHTETTAASSAAFGEVDFPISCAPESQRPFNQAVWTLHSFWYPEALKAFTEIAERDPGCAMAYWGMGMSHWYPLWYPPNVAALKAGSEAVAKALAASPKTDREKGYIAAIAAFYQDSDSLDHRARALAYEKAMEQVYLRYPEDREAAVFYALALNATASPTDKTYANKKKAAEILNKIFAELPNHPGAVHYLIHSDDTQQSAQAGLPAAICYAKIAPDVPHALHMPSHIFTRLGLWQQSIESNVAAHAAALKYAQESLGAHGFDGETVHSMDYLEYAYLQTGQDAKAKQIVDELLSYRQSSPANLPMAYAVSAIPVRYVLERRDWHAATMLSEPAIGVPLGQFPWGQAMIAFAHALGAAQTGDLAGAQREIDKLLGFKEQLLQAKDNYWANRVEVQRLGASAVLAYAQGDKESAIKLARAAADLDATMDKHPATPAEVLPARELLADLLLQSGEPAAALKEYEELLRSEPNRFRSLLGKARAAEQSGDMAMAKTAYQKLLALSSQADADTPELAGAKAFLSKNI